MIMYHGYDLQDYIEGLSHITNKIIVCARNIMPYTHRKRRICAAQIATRPVCIEQYISICSKPARRVSLASRRVACSVHAA